MKPEQITAWALDEASAEERQQLEAALLENPQDKLKADDTKAFCDFLLSELRDDSLALTDKQREQLVRQASNSPEAGATHAPQSASRLPLANVTRTPQTKWRIGIIAHFALAACVTLGGFWTWQLYFLKHAARQVAVFDDPGFKVNLPMAIDSKMKPGQPAEKTKKPPLPMIMAMEPPAGKPLAPAPLPTAVAGVPAMALNKEQKQLPRGDGAKLKQIQDQNAYALNFGDKKEAMAADLPVVHASPSSTTAAATSTPFSLPTATDKVQSGLLLANGSAESGNYDAAIGQYQNVLRTDPYNAAARRGIEATEKKRMGYFKTAYDHQRTKMLAQVAEPWAEQVPVQAGSVVMGKDVKTDAFYLGSNGGAEYRKREAQSQPSTRESYTRIIENELKDVARVPLSTLSIDVDTASYANVRRFLNQNMIPPPDAVRIEELVNYFPTAEEGPAHDAKEPFGVRIELAPCPWQPMHRLARIAIKGRELDKDRKASNLVFLVDVSGSMNEPTKLPLVQQSLRLLTEQLGEGDRVTMVVYAGSSGVVLPPTSGEKKEAILGAINRLSAGGSTHGSAGIKLAYEQAVAVFIKGGVNRVILCTDGDFNVGVSSPDELEKLIKDKAKTGVFLSVLGFGCGNLQDRTMETLADKGNGNYAYIDSLSEARKVLVEQMSGTLETIAKDVKIQVEFNPAAVRSYRLIGYENRLLAKEDFNDDTKDAGEIGAGHSVVALYEIVPANLPPGAEPRQAVDNLKYQAPAISPSQLAEAAKSGEMMTVKLRYKAPDSDLSKLIEIPTKDEGKTLTASSEEFKFSAAVAGFGLLLRDSSYKGTLSWETVRRLALDGKGADKLGYRGEFFQLIDKARGLKETR
ncbi:MAG: hypothetical protein B7Z37_16315 [Verrucomicrobia bacterium 12-59-8]|nr:MAG: hypothetical protein B7Z37_16315 [Verrucomicrobia bacterium 12-59-8]